MSDAPPPQDELGPGHAAGAAHLQQRALERDLLIEDLERTVEALISERMELREELRVLRAPPELPTQALSLRARARDQVRALRERAVRMRPGLPLASFPVARGTAPVWWVIDADVLGVHKPALPVDPPGTWSWDLRLPKGTAVRGEVSLKPTAWDKNDGGFDLVVELFALSGAAAPEPVTSFVLGVDPATRAGDRRWIPWRVELAAAGPHRLVISTRVPLGASPDYAWTLLGDPRLELPGLARRARATSRKPANAVSNGPTIAMLLPVHNPDVGLLDRTLAAVAGQTLAAWELCIVDDGCTDHLVRDRLARAAAEDSRVKLHRHERAQGISGATNAALKLATAPYVATLDHDDVLAPDAIESMANELAARPELDFLYSDNDLLAGARRRFSASLKPDWSPDLLRACMYTLHFAVYRRTIIEQLGGWRSALDGAQDHDLVLRLSEITDRIGHLPRVLYHWRAHAGSAALGDLAKPLAYDRGRQAITEHLMRTGHPRAQVEQLPEAGRYRVRYPRTKPVTLMIPVRGDGLDAGVRSAVEGLLAILRPGDVVELTPVLASSLAPVAGDRAADLARAIGDARVRVGPGEREAAPTTLIYFEHAVRPARADAIDELAGHVEAGASAAGGIVTDAAGLLVAGGVAFPQGLAVPLYPDANMTAQDLPPALTMVTNVSALRGVVAFGPGSAPTNASGAGFADQTLWNMPRGAIVWSPHAQFQAADAVAEAFLVWPVDEIAAMDRGARPDPFWNPQRWADRGDATVPESLHENPLLDLVDR